MRHNVVGVDGNGQLLQLITTGRLEAMGEQLRRYGAVRALCLDNSGSSVVCYRPGHGWRRVEIWPRSRGYGLRSAEQIGDAIRTFSFSALGLDGYKTGA
jgi:hypothetical protein